MHSEKITRVALRAVAMFWIIIFTSAIVGTGFIPSLLTQRGLLSERAIGGVLDLGHKSITQQPPFYLSGEWEAYPGVLLMGDTVQRQKLIHPSLVNMPIMSARLAEGPATYRLLVKNEGQSLHNGAIYLSHLNEDMAVYINGKRQMPVQMENKLRLPTVTHFMFALDVPEESQFVEIIISANQNNTQTLFYKNPMVMGENSTLFSYFYDLGRDTTFIIGLTLIMSMVGLIFMLMRARMDIITSITLFDVFLGMRILLGFREVNYFLHGLLLPVWDSGSVDFVALQYVAFFLTGLVGSVLAQTIFDPQHKLPVWPVRLQMAVCLLGALLSFFVFRKWEAWVVGGLFLVLVYSFSLVTYQVYHLLKSKNCTGYLYFQIAKTYYVGALMAADILLFRGIIAFNAFVYGYILFFFAHLFTRLLDSNASYLEVERLNRNLEGLVAERTEALTKANRRLAEITIRDPLTGAYNRLHFERMLELKVQEAKHSLKPLCLCIFDLDHFKQVNDTFGHDKGDEQLKFLVLTAQHVLAGEPLRCTLARVGGEEFTVLFTDMALKEAQQYLETLRLRLEEKAQAEPAYTTASFGLVQFTPNMDKKSLFQLADQFLYHAKSSGRNCIMSPLNTETLPDRRKQNEGM